MKFSLSLKTFAFVTVTTTAFMVVVLMIVFHLEQMAITSDDTTNLKNGAHQVAKMLDSDLEVLNSKLFDWSTWDDSYRFITDRNQDYITNNLNDATFDNLKLNGFVYVATSGAIVYEKGYDYLSHRAIPIPADLHQFITYGSPLTTYTSPTSSKSGILRLLNGTAMLFAAGPIVKSNGTGPIRGSLIFLRLIDRSSTERYSNITGLTVESITPNPRNKQLPPIPLRSQDINLDVRAYFGKSAGQRLTGILSVDDPFGSPAVDFHYTSVRSLFLETQNNNRFFVLALGISGLFFVGVTLFLMQTLILTPVAKIRDDVTEITRSGNIRERLRTTTSNDELSVLTKEINQMLAKIENSQKLLANEKEKSKAYIDIVNVMIVVIAKDQTIQMLNREACRILETTEENAVGKNWFDTFIPVQEREVLRDVFLKMMAGNLGFFEHNENLVLTASGKERLFSWHNSLLKDEVGQVTASLSVADDITERSEALKVLIEKEKLLTFTQQLAHIGSWAFDLRTRRFTIMDNSVYHINGINPAETGDTIKDLLKVVIPEDHQKIVAALSSIIAKNVSSLDFYYRTTQARIVHVLAEVSETINGEPVRVLGALQDVTDQKQAEDKLLARTKEMETLNNLMIGREVKMVELKNELNELKKQAEHH